MNTEQKEIFVSGDERLEVVADGYHVKEAEFPGAGESLLLVLRLDNTVERHGAGHQQRHFGRIVPASGKHIVETTRLLNIMKPEQIAPMALAVQPGTELAKQVETGEFIQATPLQILEEEKYLLNYLAGFETIYWGDHGNNIVSSKGRLPASRELFLGKIDQAIANHPVTEQEILLVSPW